MAEKNNNGYLGEIQYAFLGDYNAGDVWEGKRRDRISPDQYADANLFKNPAEMEMLRQYAAQMATAPLAGGGGNFQMAQGRGDAMAGLRASMAANDNSALTAQRDLGAGGLNTANDFQMRRQALREMLRQQELNRQTKEDEVLRNKRDIIGYRMAKNTMKGVSSGMAGGSGGGSAPEESSQGNGNNPYGYGSNPFNKSKER